MTAEACSAGSAISVLPFRQAFADQTSGGAFCEGMIAAGADQASSVAIWAHFGLGFPHATVSLSMSFLGPARGSPLTFDTDLIASSSSLGQTSVTVTQPCGLTVARGFVDFALGSYPGDPGLSNTGKLTDPALLGSSRIDPFEGDDVVSALQITATAPEAYILPYRPNMVGSRDPAALHGGAIVAAAVASARSVLDQPARWRIIQLSADYLRAGLPAPAEMLTRVVSRTRRTALIEVDVLQSARSRQIARVRMRFYA